MTDELDLDAIEARAEAATDGPWNFAYAPNPEAGDETKAEYLANTCDPNSPEPLWVCWTPDPEGGSDDYVIPALTGDGPTSRSNVEFIAHARDDVPALVDAVRTLTAENERLRGKVERVEALIEVGEFWLKPGTKIKRIESSGKGFTKIESMVTVDDVAAALADPKED